MVGFAALHPPYSSSIPVAPHPELEHLQRRGAIVVGGFREGAVIALLDPGLIGPRAVARQGQPHQSARRLARQPVAIEQHLTEQRLGLMLALLRGETEPARAVAEIVTRGIRRL